MAERAAEPKTESRGLSDLTRLIQRSDGFVELTAALKNGRSGTIDGAWGSSGPLAIAALSWQIPSPLLVVLPHIGDLEEFAEDLAAFAGLRVEIVPAWEKSPAEAPPGDELIGRRLRVARSILSDDPPRLVVAPIPALLQPFPGPEALARGSRKIRVGETIPLEELIGWLTERGMTRVEVVEVAGEFSLRGGILDVFPTDQTLPFRVEFFGDDVDSIRPFDPETQRSLGKEEEVSLAVPLDPGLTSDETSHLIDLFPEGSVVALVEPTDLKEQGERYLGRLSDPRGFYTLESVFKHLIQRPSVTVAAVSAGMSLETTCRLRVESVERFSGELSKVKEELETASEGNDVLIACRNQSEIDRLTEVFEGSTLVESGRVRYTVGRVRSGFRLVDHGVLVIGDHELFDRGAVRQTPKRRRYESRAIDSFLDLNEGDLVVHVSHGIARYRGLQLIEKDRDAGYAEEQLVLEFADRARIYVPIAKIELVQKYVGGGKADPALSKIGTSSWERKKKRVAEAVADLAQDLIEIQAQRASQPGIAYEAEDGRWLTEFEAGFPYQETPDQLAAIEAIKGDMSAPKPMDRLICGDVGYGKTEVAMRAAFKAVEGGRQVAVLVPTTVLAEQHHRSFSARMAEFPVRIEAVSRFRPKSEVRQVLKETSAGRVDILIGTHRIVQKDVAFHDLGLIIIDEEQRFGVEDKEWLKSLRATVEVLTLTATPIPRTLHMALLGIRDISNLETPPPDRKAVETRISRWDDELIRQAIVRELNREGQIYFVHNKVYDIESIADRVRSLVPDARVIVGHGQMTGDQLERAMLAFVRREADVLVATTIIESGLDIPNANTIFIDEADRDGLADLLQLRGRVGRSKRRAYAYLLLDPKRTVAPNAVRRLKAIEEFTDLGAGFKIALRDLEIRGAGNILGAEQSGHIEAVGYELYCSLLDSAVRAMSGRAQRPNFDCSVELQWRAYLPASYVPSHKLKVELYRRASRLRSLEQLEDFRKELVDRFGPLPLPTAQMLTEAELRIYAEHWQIARIHLEDEFLVLTYRNPRRIEALGKQYPGRIRIVDSSSAYVPLEGATTADAIAKIAVVLLHPSSPVVTKGATTKSKPKATRPPKKSAKGGQQATRVTPLPISTTSSGPLPDETPVTVHYGLGHRMKRLKNERTPRK